ncbi:hypothetical protein BdWA1_002559 [Babesia duncani]|uniref:Uncharacterized protein n=1 Tax=Babesia duncani TaxID=323732 RepID=A0AAD9PJG2_9APIC|nr:hypothetical protein BdWA1_002559 [Babesia duncani]
MNRLLDSIVYYRIELYPYFFQLFSELRHVHGLETIVSAIEDSGALKLYKVNTLIDLFYYYSSLIGKSGQNRAFSNALAGEIYDKIRGGQIRFNKGLLSKLLHALNSGENTPLLYKQIARLVLPAIHNELEDPTWHPKRVISILTCLANLQILQEAHFKLACSTLQARLDDLNTGDLETLFQLCKEFKAPKLARAVKDKILLYNQLAP